MWWLGPMPPLALRPLHGAQVVGLSSHALPAWLPGYLQALQALQRLPAGRGTARPGGGSAASGLQGRQRQQGPSKEELAIRSMHSSSSSGSGGGKSAGSSRGRGGSKKKRQQQAAGKQQGDRAPGPSQTPAPAPSTLEQPPAERQQHQQRLGVRTGSTGAGSAAEPTPLLPEPAQAAVASGPEAAGEGAGEAAQPRQQGSEGADQKGANRQAAAPELRPAGAGAEAVPVSQPAAGPAATIPLFIPFAIPLPTLGWLEQLQEAAGRRGRQGCSKPAHRGQAALRGGGCIHICAAPGASASRPCPRGGGGGGGGRRRPPYQRPPRPPWQ